LRSLLFPKAFSGLVRRLLRSVQHKCKSAEVFLMKARSRPGRSIFFGYMAFAYVAIFMAVPLVSALEPASAGRSAASGSSVPPSAPPAESRPNPSASAGNSAAAAMAAAIPERASPPDFQQADRNHDGLVDKSEAGAVPGLSANFERADANKDGKLDRDEFERGGQVIDAPK
jgi:hypothetical protein